MSLLPLLFSDWWENLDSPHQILGQSFGEGLFDDDLLVPDIPLDFYIPQRMLNQYGRSDRKPRYVRPWVRRRRRANAGTSTVKPDRDMFRVVLDVQHFKPEEITVKLVDRFVVVEGKHEEKQDEHGWISRQFTRKYLIPAQCDLEQVKSTLSSDGVLTITAPRKRTPKQQQEKYIEIECTGKPAITGRRDTKQESIEETIEERKEESKEETKQENKEEKEESKE